MIIICQRSFLMNFKIYILTRKVQNHKDAPSKETENLSSLASYLNYLDLDLLI